MICIALDQIQGFAHTKHSTPEEHPQIRYIF